MTKYLKNYIEYIEENLKNCSNQDEIEDILNEHLNKISFMQHERLVHFLVTMMFALILVMFIIAELITENILLLILIVMVFCLLGAYIKHYYFLENTVQKMYVIYDEILSKRKNLTGDFNE